MAPKAPVCRNVNDSLVRETAHADLHMRLHCTAAKRNPNPGVVIQIISFWFTYNSTPESQLKKTFDHVLQWT